MKPLWYLLCLTTALPCAAFAMGLLVLNHVIVTRNPLTLLYHFFIAFGRGLPALVVVLLCFVAAAFFPTPRFIGAVTLLAVNLAALAIILVSPALPKTLSEAVFLLPALGSIALALVVVLGK